MTKESSITLSTVVPSDLGPRIKALRVEGQNIFSVSTVVRAALIRGLAQLELERGMGRSIVSDPLPIANDPSS
jgi:hypothetical protein